MVVVGVVDLPKDIVRQRLGEVDADDLRADVLAQGPDLQKFLLLPAPAEHRGCKPIARFLAHFNRRFVAAPRLLTPTADRPVRADRAGGRSAGSRRPSACAQRRMRTAPR